MTYNFGSAFEPFQLTRKQVVDYLKDQVCSLEEPYAGPNYHDDHGHTHCLYIGRAIQLLTERHARDEHIIRETLLYHNAPGSWFAPACIKAIIDAADAGEAS